MLLPSDSLFPSDELLPDVDQETSHGASIYNRNYFYYLLRDDDDILQICAAAVRVLNA